MLSSRKLIIVGASVFGIVASTPMSALAVFSYYGANYSFDYSQKTAITVCDNESDGDGAYVKFVVNGSGSTLQNSDPNGSSDGCGGSTGWSNGIFSHQTCEDQAWQPDPCGAKVYPT